MISSELKTLSHQYARTFAFVFEYLPNPLDNFFATAYLLVRLSDNIADSITIPYEQRVQILTKLHKCLLEKKIESWSPDITLSWIQKKDHDLILSYRILIKLAKQTVDYQLILQLWETILQGQLFDLQRFYTNKGSLLINELENYCFLVAGVVGQIWAKMIIQFFPNKIIDLSCTQRLEKSAIYLGQALQLLNILCDAKEDLLIGRKYFDTSQEEFLIKRIEEWLEIGKNYLNLLKPSSILQASAIPYNLALCMLKERKKYRCWKKLSSWKLHAQLLKSNKYLIYGYSF